MLGIVWLGRPSNSLSPIRSVRVTAKSYQTRAIDPPQKKILTSCGCEGGWFCIWQGGGAPIARSGQIPGSHFVCCAPRTDKQLSTAPVQVILWWVYRLVISWNVAPPNSPPLVLPTGDYSAIDGEPLCSSPRSEVANQSNTVLKKKG